MKSSIVYTLVIISNQCVGEFNGRRLYTGVTLDYRLRLWAPRTISAVAELFVDISWTREDVPRW